MHGHGRREEGGGDVDVVIAVHTTDFQSKAAYINDDPVPIMRS